MPKDTKTKKTKATFSTSDTSSAYAPAVIIIMVAVTGTVFAIIGYITAMSTVMPMEANSMPTKSMDREKAMPTTTMETTNSGTEAGEAMPANNAAPRNW